jgi:formylmethanofuran dehydrogenase subunit C
MSSIKDKGALQSVSLRIAADQIAVAGNQRDFLTVRILAGFVAVDGLARGFLGGWLSSQISWAFSQC